MSKFLYLILLKIERFSVKFRSKFIYKGIFKEFGDFSYIEGVNRLINPKLISIGKNVNILKGAWLSASPLNRNDNTILKIGDGCSIGNYSHIYATKEIIIEAKVLIADKVYISDNLHSYADVQTAIIDQEVIQISFVKIGKGAWIGENVCIIGASVGENSVIGANSVVTNDIPDYCVAVGSPARVIKKYNKVTKLWEKYC